MEFWQWQIDECRGLLQGVLPLRPWNLGEEPLRYLPFMHRMLTILALAVEGQASESELERTFDLLPQISNRAPFIQVTAQALHRQVWLTSNYDYRLSHERNVFCGYLCHYHRVKAPGLFCSINLRENALCNNSGSSSRGFFTLYVGEPLPAASLLLLDLRHWTIVPCCNQYALPAALSWLVLPVIYSHAPNTVTEQQSDCSGRQGPGRAPVRGISRPALLLHRCSRPGRELAASKYQ